MKISKLLTACLAILGVAATANAQLNLTFDSDVQGFTRNVIWSPGPVGWAGGGSLKANPSVGGWTMGSGGGPTKDYDWFHGQPEITAIAASGQGRVSFDIMVDGTSFDPFLEGWFQVWHAGNSDGGAGWTQSMLVDAYQNMNDARLRTWHFDEPFSAVGWQPGDTWFQIWFGANSDAAFPVAYFIDNVQIYQVPEPTSFGLLGLGALALLISRRRS